MRRGADGDAPSAADQGAAARPTAPGSAEPPEVTRAKRGFLRRAAGYLAADAGIRQFVDIGSRLPADDGIGGAVHEHAPDARVVYVETGSTVPIRGCGAAGDAAVSVAAVHRPDPASLISLLDLRGLVDFGEPAAFFLVDTAPPEDGGAPAAGLVDALHAAMCPGGFLALALPPDSAGAGDGGRARSAFGAFTLLDPGLADLAWWPYPDEDVAGRGTGIPAGLGRR
nr:SAM-dependent methyltransferase [Nocardiopsis mwathae]